MRTNVTELGKQLEEKLRVRLQIIRMWKAVGARSSRDVKFVKNKTSKESFGSKHQVASRV